MKLYNTLRLLVVTLALCVFGAIIPTAATAQNNAPFSVKQYNGSPNTFVTGNKGDICKDLSANTLWIKSGGNGDKVGWIACNFSAEPNLITGTTALSSGIKTVTNSAFTGTSYGWVTATGTAAGGALSTSFSGTILTIQSMSGSDARTIRYGIYNP